MELHQKTNTLSKSQTRPLRNGTHDRFEAFRRFEHTGASRPRTKGPRETAPDPRSLRRRRPSPPEDGRRPRAGAGGGKRGARPKGTDASAARGHSYLVAGGGASVAANSTDRRGTRDGRRRTALRLAARRALPPPRRRPCASPEPDGTAQMAIFATCNSVDLRVLRTFFVFVDDFTSIDEFI